MSCNTAPLPLDSATQSVPESNLSLKNFLNQYMQTQDPKFQTIQQTLQKVETQGFTPTHKSDRGINVKALTFDNNTESAGILSSKTSRTLDSSKKTSLNSHATPTSLTTPDTLPDESTERRNSNPASRAKAKSKAQTYIDQVNQRPGRQSAMPSLWCAYRSKSPSGSNNALSSFFSDHANLSQPSIKPQLTASIEGDSASDEEDRGDFLMIKPLTTVNPNPKFHQPLKTQNFNLNLDDTLFPKEIIDFTDSLQESNLGAYVRSLIEFIYSFKDYNTFFSTKRPISEALYSIYFEGETLEMFKKLLQQVLEKLKEESITLKQKFRSEIEFIGAKHSKIFKCTAKTKFEEKELQKLQSKIVSILQERCLINSQSALNLLHHFLEKILEKFPSLAHPNALKLGKSVIIDNITLPKLLERLLEHSNPSMAFYRSIAIYTYDLYTTAQNLMLYLIQRYFEPEPLNMSASELRMYRAEVLKHSKVHILKLLAFWIEERTGDFTRNPDIIVMLSTFLDIISPIEKEKDVISALTALTLKHDELNEDIQTQKQKVCEKVDQHVSLNRQGSVNYSGPKPDISLIARVVSVSDGTSLLKEELHLGKAGSHQPSLVKKSPFAGITNPQLHKSGSLSNLVFGKGSDAPINLSSGSGSSRHSTTTPNVPSPKFRFWTSFQNKAPYDEKMLLEENSEEIAKHLTVIDWKYFSRISIHEMIKKRWTKGDKAECRYYFKYVKRFNSFCSWIQYIVLCNESFRRRTEIAEKFLEIAVMCLNKYSNFFSSHYIFAAVSSLEKFGVISLQEPPSANYEELKKTFVPSENFLGLEKERVANMKGPATPNLNFFLQSFLKLQDGVMFWIKLPESSKYKYLKFPLLVQIQDLCKEMRRFQKSGYEDIDAARMSPLYKFLKKGFKKDGPTWLEDKDEALNKLAKMVSQVKEKQSKLLSFFGMKSY